MISGRWDSAAAPGAHDPVGQCVYGSRLLGAEPALVLHGGGNTSVKTTVPDVFGDLVEVLYVKGSGWDLATIERAGFTALRLDRLRRLLGLGRLTDTQMMNELRAARLDASAPDPSVESLLHALLPHAAVLHSHADALVTLTNQPDGAAVVRSVLGADVVVVPYVMPGFDLAKLCAATVPAQLAPDTPGLVLLNHGLFTFGASTQEAYQRHVELVGRAERFLARHRPQWADEPQRADQPRSAVAPAEIAALRKEISDVAGRPMVVSRHDNARVRGFLARPERSQRGPLTPDHVIRTKRVPLLGRDVAGYAREYRRYFDEHKDRRGVPLTMLDPAPRVLLDPAYGMLTAGPRVADADIAADIYHHTIDVIATAESVGSYQALDAADLFDVEYWELEQAKLGRAGAPAPFTGEVALVTGAASGIGRACAQALRARGAAVVGLDLSPGPAEAPDYLAVRVDVTDPAGVTDAVRAGVERFGGVDMLVAAAGVFPAAQPLAGSDPAAWRQAMAVNAESVAYLFGAVHPLLALAPRGGRVVVVASKNVRAPGPGAAAYSASKAAVTQLARVAALEWAGDGIRVNLVHPDAVFDTGLWTEELLADRAARYGLSVAAYKRRNLLGMEVTSRHVGEVVAALCSDGFAATTGAQVPVDGGNERVV
ncbi:MAG TPA: bifunctional aldolase/short-chain dehydrogenase [Micromonosporaceae bacterium]|nr:bifunctional aldolase/short-chain dehydrogenase [Micromonosporaceae bacterium]